MLKRFWKTLLRGSWESLLAVVLVGVFALVFLGIFMLMFPKGSGLVDLYGEMFGGGGRRAETGKEVGGAGEEPAEPDAVVATLASVSRSVKERGAEAIEWKAARAGMPVYNRQAIQTLARSGAVVALGQRDEMTLGENTLAVFTRPEREDGAGGRQASLLLVGGEIHGSVSSQGGAGHDLAVLTAGGATTIRSGGRSPAQFAVKVSPEKTSTISIFSGSAEVSAAGKTLRLGPNQAVTVDPSGGTGSVVSLPETPAPVSPADGAVSTFGRAAPRIEFRWTEVGAADGYDLVIARDSEFQNIVLDKAVRDTRFVHGSLAPGRYFWRVSSLHGKAAGPAGPVRELRLVPDTDPPRLDLEIPAEVRDPAGLLVRGRTEPGSRVFIDNERIPVSATGEFERQLVLRRGVNMIVIEAVDAAGNSAYQAKYVNAKF